MCKDKDQSKIKISTSDDISVMLAKQISNDIKSIKIGKSTGNVNVWIEMVKAGGEILHKILANLLSKCLKEQKVPDSCMEKCWGCFFFFCAKRDLRIIIDLLVFSQSFKKFSPRLFKKE